MSPLAWRSKISSDRDGFTITEMLVVLLVASVASAALSYSVYGVRKSETAREFALDLQQMLSSAHQKAMVTGTAQDVIIDLAPASLQASWNGADLPAPANFRADALIGRELVEAGGSVTVRFFGQGGSTGARIRVRDQQGRLAVITTNWLTGISRAVEGQDANRSNR